jgi:hypothetical protein
MEWPLAAAVFAIGLILDYADTRHKVAIERRDANAASVWSVIMYGLSILATWAAVDVSGWLVLPAAAGLVAGTQLALRRVPAEMRRVPKGSQRE